MNKNRVLDVSSSSQQIVNIQQMFRLAGKRNKLINLARENVQLSEFEYYDLLRTLKFELRSNIFNTYYAQRTILMYNDKINSIERLVNLYDDQFKKGNIPLKEVIRLKALLFDLNNQRLMLHDQIHDYQQNINLLLSLDARTYHVPSIDQKLLDEVNPDLLNYDEIQQTALSSRYDLKIYQSQERISEANLKLQKSMAVPDLGLGVVYDRAGSFTPNYLGFGIQIALPVFNRNQGNIKIAQHQIDEYKQLYQQQSRQIQNEVAASLNKILEADRLYKYLDKNFTTEFDTLISNILQNYEKRNIGLLEFLDYYETYTESMIVFFQLQNQRINSLEELQYAVGTKLFNY